MSTLNVQRAASFYHPVMLAQESGEISEAKAAELLGLDVMTYREHKQQVIMQVMKLVEVSLFPLRSVLDIMKARPDLFE